MTPFNTQPICLERVCDNVPLTTSDGYNLHWRQYNNTSLQNPKWSGPIPKGLMSILSWKGRRERGRKREEGRKEKFNCDHWQTWVRGYWQERDNLPVEILWRKCISLPQNRRNVLKLKPPTCHPSPTCNLCCDWQGPKDLIMPGDSNETFTHTHTHLNTTLYTQHIHLTHYIQTTWIQNT